MRELWIYLVFPGNGLATVLISMSCGSLLSSNSSVCKGNIIFWNLCLYCIWNSNIYLYNVGHDYSFHALRYTFATLILTAGSDIHTKEIYADVVMDKKVDAVNMLNGIFWLHKKCWRCLRFLAMTKFKHVWLCSFGLTKTFDVRVTIRGRAWNTSFPSCWWKKCLWEMELLGKNTYKTSFFFAK